jgi:hypothetical protein
LNDIYKLQFIKDTSHTKIAFISRNAVDFVTLLRRCGDVPTRLGNVCLAWTRTCPRALQRLSTLLWRCAHALAQRLSCMDENMPTRAATAFYAAVAMCPRACAAFVLHGQERAHARCNGLLRCCGEVPTRLRSVCPAWTRTCPRALQRPSTLLWRSAHALAQRLQRIAMHSELNFK